MNNTKIFSVITEHKSSFLKLDDLIKRDLITNNSKIIYSKEIVVITGVRRSGKSSLLKLIAKELLSEGVPKNNLLYINFDDERLLNFKVDDFDNLFYSYIELENPQGKVYIFLDEIQNISQWEKWVNRKYEMSDVKIFVTGSNSSILSSEYSGLLTGRNRQITNFPFSFKEYLMFKNIDIDKLNIYDNLSLSEIKRELSNYVQIGGFPEMLKNEDFELLEQYFKDIIFRDIIVKNKIRNSLEVREMALILSSGIATIQSIQKLKNAIGIKSNSSVKTYLELFSDSFLFFQLNLFSYSVKNQVYNPKKNYCIDTGLARAVSFEVSENEGRYYENVVFIELLRRKEDIYYWKSKSNLEIDFVIKRGINIVKAIQVSIDISNEKTRKRELDALAAFYEETKIEELYLLNKDEDTELIYNGLKVKIIPIWKWLIFEDNKL